MGFFFIRHVNERCVGEYSHERTGRSKRAALGNVVRFDEGGGTFEAYCAGIVSLLVSTRMLALSMVKRTGAELSIRISSAFT